MLEIWTQIIPFSLYSNLQIQVSPKLELYMRHDCCIISPSVGGLRAAD